MSGKTHKIDWESVRRVLVIRLRSIGDTVLATPALVALRRFLPNAEIDLLLEDWVVPLIAGSEEVDTVIPVGKGVADRAATATRLRRRRYDTVINLHGGTTSTFFAVVSGARHRIGYGYYRYSFLYNHRLESSSAFWGREKTHSAEQQLALIGFTGVPVEDLPACRLPINQMSMGAVSEKLGLGVSEVGGGHLFEKDGRRIALIHPAAATFTKQWGTDKFAEVADSLYGKELQPVAVAARSEKTILDRLVDQAESPIMVADDLSLPEITALAAGARIFVGNDSGIAHIAAAVGTPPVVIFGSSNRDHWRPWTEGPSRSVFTAFPCQPCPGYNCAEFDAPRCILEVSTAQVTSAVEEVLQA